MTNYFIEFNASSDTWSEETKLGQVQYIIIYFPFIKVILSPVDKLYH